MPTTATTTADTTTTDTTGDTTVTTTTATPVVDYSLALAAVESTRHHTARKALSAMRTVGPAQVAAMREVESLDDGLTLAGLMTAVHAIAEGDVAEVAALTVAAYWTGATGEGAERTLKAARAAVKAARRTVTLAAVADDWDQTGDMVEVVDVLAVGEPVWGGQWTAPRPDRCATTTTADVVDLAVETLTGESWVALSGAVETVRTHRCAQCEDLHAAGRRVTLAGMPAHHRGVKASDGEGKRLARAVTRAVGEVDRAAVLREVGALPGAGSKRLAARMVAPSGRDESVTDAVTVTYGVDALGYRSALGYGPRVGVETVTRPRTETERAATARTGDTPGTVVYVDADGHERTMTAERGSTAPASAGDRRACAHRDADGFALACDCQTGAAVRAFKAPASPRKKGSRSGMGPSIPATLSGR